MDGEHSMMRRRSLKERLGLNGMACCGAAWGLGPTDMSERDEGEDEEGPIGPLSELPDVPPSPMENGPTQSWVRQSPSLNGMNLAAALAAERQFMVSLDSNYGGASASPITSPPRPNSNDERSPMATLETARTTPRTPMRVSLMRLLEEADDGVMRKEDDRAACDLDTVCCVCMGRKKGAAFIPCGHTFCRVCSRELWLTRGSCPLCNRKIGEILDIY